MNLRILTILLISILIVAFGCGGKGIYKRTELAMGTVVEISVADKDKDPEAIEKAICKAFDRIKEIEALMSSYLKGSDVSRINRLGKGKYVAVSDETFEVIRTSIKFSKLSEGAFDITILPVLELWGFSSKIREDVPTQEEIGERLPLVNFRNILIDEEERAVGFSVAEMEIDLGGIAKGYAVDEAIVVLKNEGIKKAMVNAGGDVYCLGTKDNDQLWVIGIKHPRKPGQILTTLEIKGQAIATSGDYEKYYTIKGKRYPHIIDPRTGRPVQNDVMSVTILAPTCLEADALATTCFVLGKEKGLKLIGSLDGVEGMIVSQQGSGIEVGFSKGLAGTLRLPK